ncbi:MAG: hypothetical protein H6725_19030 [Sandaracinaceae bacterium]|nr:hypothetical protein [Sandaracinaceae bacterium]
MTYAVCLVCSDKPLRQQRGAKEALVDVIVQAWNGARGLRGLEALESCEPLRPPHALATLADRFALGPNADEAPALLSKLAVFQPDKHGDRFLRAPRGEGWLNDVGRAVSVAFLDRYFELYPWGRAGFWLADMRGATQLSPLRVVEGVSRATALETCQPNSIVLVGAQDLACAGLRYAWSP